MNEEAVRLRRINAVRSMLIGSTALVALLALAAPVDAADFQWDGDCVSNQQNSNNWFRTCDESETMPKTNWLDPAGSTPQERERIPGEGDNAALSSGNDVVTGQNLVVGVFTMPTDAKLSVSSSTNMEIKPGSTFGELALGGGLVLREAGTVNFLGITSTGGGDLGGDGGVFTNDSSATINLTELTVGKNAGSTSFNTELVNSGLINIEGTPGLQVHSGDGKAGKVTNNGTVVFTGTRNTNNAGVITTSGTGEGEFVNNGTVTTVADDGVSQQGSIGGNFRQTGGKVNAVDGVISATGKSTWQGGRIVAGTNGEFRFFGPGEHRLEGLSTIEGAGTATILNTSQIVIVEDLTTNMNAGSGQFLVNGNIIFAPPEPEVSTSSIDDRTTTLTNTGTFVYNSGIIQLADDSTGTGELLNQGMMTIQGTDGRSIEEITLRNRGELVQSSNLQLNEGAELVNEPDGSYTIKDGADVTKGLGDGNAVTNRSTITVELEKNQDTQIAVAFNQQTTPPSVATLEVERVYDPEAGDSNVVQLTGGGHWQGRSAIVLDAADPGELRLALTGTFKLSGSDHTIGCKAGGDCPASLVTDDPFGSSFFEIEAGSSLVFNGVTSDLGGAFFQGPSSPAGGAAINVAEVLPVAGTVINAGDMTLEAQGVTPTTFQGGVSYVNRGAATIESVRVLDAVFTNEAGTATVTDQGVFQKGNITIDQEGVVENKGRWEIISGEVISTDNNAPPGQFLNSGLLIKNGVNRWQIIAELSNTGVFEINQGRVEITRGVREVTDDGVLTDGTWVINPDFNTAAINLPDLVEIGMSAAVTANTASLPALKKLERIAGVLTLNGAATPLFENALQILQGGRIENAPNAPAGVLTLSALAIGPLAVDDPDVNTSLISDGSLAPGMDGMIGDFVVGADYTQSETGTLLIDLAGLIDGIDQLHVGGTATLDGDVHVNVLDGFRPNVGDRFTFLEASSVVGVFAGLTKSGLPGLNFELVYTDTSVALEVVPLPPGVLLFGTALSGGWWLRRSRRKA